MDEASVIEWLGTTSCTWSTDSTTVPTTVLSASLKRKRNFRHHRYQPPTPARSNESMSSSREESPTKRQMADDETPRPRRKRIQYPRSDSSYSLASRSQASEHSGLAGRLSPQKHLNALELGNEGIVVRELASLRDPPTSLAELLKTMRQISRGRHILDSASRIELGKHTHPAIVEIAEDDACFSPSRGDLGHVPDSTSILNVLDAAIECQENFHAESSWNMLVHSQLLQLALHQPGAPSFSHFVNYMPWYVY